MNNYDQSGDVLSLIAPYNLSSGQAVLIGAIFCVAGHAASAGKPFPGVTTGVFRLPAPTADMGAVGDRMYWDDTNRRVTVVSTAGKFVGILTRALAVGEVTATIALCGVGVSSASVDGGGSSGALPLYLGATGTRIWQPNTRSTSNKQLQGRTFHRNMCESRTKIRIIRANYWVNIASAGTETGSGAVATISDAIEMMDGTIIPFKWTGAAQGSIPDNGFLISDEISIPYLPEGDGHFLRPFLQCTAGVVYTTLGNVIAGMTAGSPGLVLGEATLVAASGLTDQSAGGNIVNGVTTTGAVVYYPSAILSQTTRKTYWFISNSRGAGEFDALDKRGDMGELARSIGAKTGYINCSVGSDRLMFQADPAKNANRMALAAYASDAVIGDAINDVRATQTATQIAVSRAAIATQLKAVNPNIRIRHQTTSPAPSSTDSFVTLGNQTLGSGDAHRVTDNEASRKTVLPNIVGCVDVARATEDTLNSGKLKTSTIANYYMDPAGLHNTQAGYLLVEDSGVVARALQL